MIAIISGLFVGAASSVGYFLIQPYLKRATTGWDANAALNILQTTIGYVLIAVSGLLALWMILSAFVADRFTQREGVVGRILDTLDRLFAGVQRIILAFVPRFGG